MSEEKNETPETIEVVKGYANLFVGYAVGSVVTSLIRAHLPVNPNATRRRKLTNAVGTLVIADLVSDHTETYVNEKVDRIALKIKKFRGLDDSESTETTETE